MADGVQPSPEDIETNEEKGAPKPFVTPGLTQEQQWAMNHQRWLENRKITHPEDFDEDSNYLTFEEIEAREKAGRLARIAKLFAPEPDAPQPAPKPTVPLVIPDGNVADLLEKQVAICAGLIGNVAEFIAGDARPENCFPFMDRIARLMSSSAKAGRTIGQLRGIAAETKQTFVKRKEDGREGVPA